MQQHVAAAAASQGDAEEELSSSLTSSSSSSSSHDYIWAGDSLDLQQQQQQRKDAEEAWCMSNARGQLPKSEPKQSVVGACAPMSPRERSSSAGLLHSGYLEDAQTFGSSASSDTAGARWNAAFGSDRHSAAVAGDGAVRWRMWSETADSSADENIGSSGSAAAGERGFAAGLLPGKFWKKRKSKSRKKMLQVC
jgi:hypothetical protein